MKGGCKEHRAKLFSVEPVLGQEAKSTNWNTGGTAWRSGKTYFHYEGDWALAEVVQSSCGVEKFKIYLDTILDSQL